MPSIHVLIGDSKLDRVIFPPAKISDIPLPSTDGSNMPLKEYVYQFQAPPQAAVYSFVACWQNDSILGSDVEIPMTVSTTS